MTNEPSVPAGWYPTPDGQQRYWDGSAWTEHIAPLAAAAGGAGFGTVAASAMQPGSAAGAVPNSDERSMAVVAHVLGLFVSVVGPLIIFLIKKDESPYVRDQSAEALNFGLSMILYLTAYTIISIILMFVLIGFFMLLLIPFMGLGIAILHIVAAVRANKGEYYRYPLTIRFVS